MTDLSTVNASLDRLATALEALVELHHAAGQRDEARLMERRHRLQRRSERALTQERVADNRFLDAVPGTHEHAEHGAIHSLAEIAATLAGDELDAFERAYREVLGLNVTPIGGRP